MWCSDVGIYLADYCATRASHLPHRLSRLGSYLSLIARKFGYAVPIFCGSDTYRPVSQEAKDAQKANKPEARPKDSANSK